MDYKNCVYRFLNESGQIIYIGKATFLKTRMSNHNHLSSNCYKETAKIEFMSFQTKDDMEFAEAYLIAKHKPKYNDKCVKKSFSIFVPELFKAKNWNV